MSLRICNNCQQRKNNTTGTAVINPSGLTYKWFCQDCITKRNENERNKESLVSGKGSQKLITKYANKSSEMPPVILDFVYDDYEIIDGFHRIAAAKKRGDTKIKAYVPAG